MKLHPMLPVTLGALLVAACGTPGAAPSGLLSNYDGLVARDGTVRASIEQRRDDARAGTVERIFLEPALLASGAGEGLTAAEIALVLREVDRQVCYELSERFTVIPAPEAGAGRVRAVVSRIAPTGRTASAVSAASGFFIPGPIGVRVPGTLGGLSAEAELLAGNDQGQVAVILWSRNAQAIGTDNPSLSRVGDAVQLAEPFGDAVGDAFAPPDREVRAISDPDPCSRFGPRIRPGGFAARLVTGLYSPELSGAAAEDSEDADAPEEP
jgi:hypothetical protein